MKYSSFVQVNQSLVDIRCTWQPKTTALRTHQGVPCVPVFSPHTSPWTRWDLINEAGNKVLPQSGHCPQENFHKQSADSSQPNTGIWQPRAVLERQRAVGGKLVLSKSNI